MAEPTEVGAPASALKRYWIGLRAGVKLAQDPALNHIPAGHFYSPIPSAEDRRRVLQSPPSTDDILGIDLRTSEQLDLLHQLVPSYERLPFTSEQHNHRYHYDNQPFGYTDGFIYGALLLDSPPSRVIEVGSGYSSALLLDINDLVLDGQISPTFIEPYPERLRTLARPGDLDGTLRQQSLQSVGIEVFEELMRGDILFIDSTHVSKLGSDVNYLFFEILPRLRSGVRVHIHDVFFPFEYPPRWIAKGIAWNENYLLRGFLQYNDHFRIVLYNHFLSTRHREALTKAMPMCSVEGGSLWLEVV